MRTFVHLLYACLFQVLVLGICRLLTVLAIAEDYTFGMWLSAQWHGFAYDLTFILLVNMCFFVVIAAMWSLRLEHRPWHLWAVRIVSMLLLAGLCCVSFGNYVAWDLLEHPLHIDDLSMAQKQGIGRMTGDAVLLYGLPCLMVMVLFAIAQCVYVYVGILLQRVLEKNKEHQFFSPTKPWIYYAQSLVIICGLYMLIQLLVSNGFKDPHYKPIISHAKIQQMIYDPWNQVYFTYLLRERGDDARYFDYLFRDSIEQCIADSYPEHAVTAQHLDELFVKRSVNPGLLDKEPSHIFVLFIESYSSWACNGTLGASGICPEFEKFKGHAHTWDRVFEPGRNTTAAVLSMLNGMPYFGDQPAYYGGLATSITPIFADLGYRTQFYSASYLDWGDVNHAIEGNGVDHFVAYADNYQGDQANNWGLFDHEFYKNVLNDFKPQQKSINFILTTSNHLPFNVPVEEHGYKRSDITFLDNYRGGHLADSKVSHMWYADHCMRQFVDAMLDKHPDSLFVITGDHVSRHPPVVGISDVERSWVPLIIYGPNIFRKAGRHHDKCIGYNDIMATVIELIAPDNYTYASIGNNAFLTGDNVFVGAADLFSDGQRVLRWQNGNRAQVLWPDTLPGEVTLAQRYRQQMAIYWLRCNRGRYSSELKTRK